MSYEDTTCPCGDKKPTDTMLCDACFAEYAHTREMTVFKSDLPVENRRNAGIMLLALARNRKRLKNVLHEIITKGTSL